MLWKNLKESRCPQCNPKCSPAQNIPGNKPGLDERVVQFQMLELPGQPMMMHMGTMHLVQELHAEMKRVRALYDGLLYQVERVHPGETRHETAKRYLYNAEHQPHSAEAQSNE
jgi:hypothetical protein